MALLDDLQIERYSRQIVLAEIGARGQRRLLDAHVGIAGTGAAAERALAYLAAAGVGHLRGSATLAGAVDPEQRDVTFEVWDQTRDTSGGSLDAEESLDVVVVVAPSGGRASAWPGRTRQRFWIADGRAAAMPPCPDCAHAALGPPIAVDPALVGVRDALLGSVIATEVVKALLEIGTPLAGQVLAYDPAATAVHVTPVAPRPGCAVCATRT